VSLRADVEDFLYHEAELLDSWRLDDWLALLTDDAIYEIPPNDRPAATSDNTLFIIADDINRICRATTPMRNIRARARGA